MKPMYFDYAATTPLDPRVRRAMSAALDDFGNPSSIHRHGQRALAIVDAARETVVGALGLDALKDFRRVILTGSATEANNLALRGVVKKFRRSCPAIKPRLIVSAIEHESVLGTARDLGRDGVEVVVLPVDRRGVVDARKLAGALNGRTALVSVMYANNELGTVQPLADLAAAVAEFRSRENNKPRRAIDCVYPVFHSDAVQAFQFLPCRPRELGVDLLTISGHKIYGPKGVGALYLADLGSRHEFLDPMISGGGQEFGWRSGTENVPAIAGFAEAVRSASAERTARLKKTTLLREKFIKEMKRAAPKMIINGPDPKKNLTVPHIINIRFPGARAAYLLERLSLKDISVSAGSACAARVPEPSPVLLAIGLSESAAKESFRISFGRSTSVAEISALVRALTEALGSKR